MTSLRGDLKVLRRQELELMDIAGGVFKINKRILTMKKVIDAVNEFKGEWPYGVFNTIIFGKHNQGWSDFYKDNNTTLANSNWDTICTTDEFLATVAECETNFGKCGRGERFHYVHASKLLLAKDLDKELDMGIEYIFNRDVVGSFTKDKSYMIKPNGNEFSAIDDEGDIHALSASFITTYFDRATQIYTQEMANNGVLPSVGMEFMGEGYTYKDYTKSWFKLEALGVYNGQVIAKSCSEANQVQLYSEYKPLTPPITLIDGKAYQFYIEEVANVFHAIWSEERQQMCTERSYFYKRSCEGIQPLTVEVK